MDLDDDSADSSIGNVGTIQLPSSPNWYCSIISDCLEGIYVYGAKNSLKIWNMYSRTFLKSVLCHSNRITCLQWIKDGSVSNIASGSSDRKVNIIHFPTSSVVRNHKVHKVEVTAIVTSSIINDLVVSGDKNGCIVTWTYKNNVTHQSHPVQSKVTFISFLPTSKEIVVVGYQNGTLITMNIWTSAILHRMIGHTDEIQCLCWSDPYENVSSSMEVGEIENVANDNLILLASSSRDRRIYIWEVNYHGNGVLFRKYIPSKGHGADSQRSRIWASMCWIPKLDKSHPSKLLFGSEKGDVYSWDPSDSSNNPIKSFSPHSRTIFNINYLVSDKDIYIITCSMDRKISMWDLKMKEKIWDVLSIGGFVYSLDDSLCDPGMLAISVGDNTIRLWNTQEAIEDPISLKSNLYHTSLLWKGITSKVTVTRWHPSDIGILAYGTEDGRIGVIDTNNSKHTLFTSYHSSSVYDLQFNIRPSVSRKEDEEGEMESMCILYSVGGDRQIYMFELSDPNSKPENINEYLLSRNENIFNRLSEGSNKSLEEFPNRTHFHFNSKNDRLAIGNSDGIIEIYTFPRLELVTCFRDHSKLVTKVRWNPSTEYPWNYHLATASDDCSINIYNSEKHDQMKIGSLQGHKKQIVDLSWSPFDKNLIASASFDCTVQVWNTFDCKPIINFRLHESRVFTVAWSHISQDVIFSGSEDQSVILNRITSPPSHTKPPSSKVINKRKMPDSPVEVNPNNYPIEPSKNATKRLKIEFPFVNMDEDNLESCIELADSMKEKTGPVLQDCLFKESVHVKNFIANMEEKALNNEQYNDYLLGQLWKGNISNVLQLVVKKDLLNDMWVSLSAMAGYDVYKQITFIYADQLESQKEYHKSVMYFLALHEIDRAVQVYEKAYMFPEAISLAKMHFIDNSERIQAIYVKWANYFAHRSLYAQASKCYLAIGNIEKAIETLLVNSNHDTFKVARAYCDLFEDEELKQKWIERISKSI